MPKPTRITFQLDEPRVRRGNLNRRQERVQRDNLPPVSSCSDEEPPNHPVSPRGLSPEANARPPRKPEPLQPGEPHPHLQPHQNNNMFRSFTLRLGVPPLKSPPPPRGTSPLTTKPYTPHSAHEPPSTQLRAAHGTAQATNQLRNDQLLLRDDIRPRSWGLLTNLGPPSPASLTFSRRLATEVSCSHASLAPGAPDQPEFSARSPSLVAESHAYGTFDIGKPGSLVFGPHEAYAANGPLNAIATSPTQDFVAVAGREVLKILDLSGEVVSEHLNLRVGYRLNLNFSSTDVDWGVGYCRDRLATAATNGTVVLWDLNRAGQKIERLITEHTRAVHRVKFHPTTGSALFSASQDGTLKMWDVRTKDPARVTFSPKAEAVRDFRFNPMRPDEFVAGFDNGAIQLWDIRQPAHYVRKLTAHSGITLAVDWHQDGRTVASGGRDKLIKIWDTQSDSRKPTGLIQTIAPVASVRWRPHHGYQLASASLSTDYGVNVWDIHRPYIPRFTVVGHTNVTTDILWAGQDVLLSCSKDQLFLRRALDRGERCGAKEPIMYLPASSVDWSPYGDLGFVIDRPSRPPDPRPERRKALASCLHLASAFDKHFRMAPTQTSGVLHQPLADYQAFAFLAQSYALDPRDPVAATEQNFRVAFEAGHYRTAQTWKILQLLSCKFAIERPASPHPNPVSGGRPPPAPPCHPPPDAEELDEPDEWLEGIQIYDALSDDSDGPAIPPRRASNVTTPGQPDATPSTSLTPAPSIRVGFPPTLAEDFFPQGWDPSQVLTDLLTYYTDEGDAQLCCTIALVLGDRIPVLRRQREQWVDLYVELLHRLRLWVPATLVLGHCGVPELAARNQESTTVYALCWRCRCPVLGNEAVLGFWGCCRCRRPLSVCAVCHRLVRGLYAWCRGCGHGGHLNCYREWFAGGPRPPECPGACGHPCSLPLSR
ncbi:SEA (Seh1-associated) complex subunit [Massospora cicadina]|nr:SEA (Seh1-associated) complex subunit [Massospora cicadina]